MYGRGTFWGTANILTSAWYEVLNAMFFSILFLIEVCSDYLGMENGDIPNEKHQYSSYPASKARLNGIKFWACAGSLASPWIQADIGYQTYVSGVITQGDGGIVSGITADWVTSLKVSTFTMSTDDQEVFITDGVGNAKVRVSLRLLGIVSHQTAVAFNPRRTYSLGNITKWTLF